MSTQLLIGADRIALCGSLTAIGTHHHASPAVVVGIDGPLRFVAERSHRSRAALISPGFSHAVDVGVGRIAVFLLPPHAISRERLLPVGDVPRPGAWVELGQALLRGEVASFEPVDRLVARAALDTRPIDDRLRAAITVMWEALDANLSIEALASDVKLSPSRLMSLAHAQMGTSFRRYRRWLRMFRVARDYAAGASITRAALDSGFASSAHLSAAAREHFGIRPSQILTPGGRAAIRAV
jgi:AraC-like DNA-binding protein